MLRIKKHVRNAKKRAFTLIEILTCVAIIGVLALVIVGLRPGNPHGLDDACRISATEFKIAKSKAVMGTNPDREPDTNKRYNIRSAVLVLNNSDDPDRHLRFVMPIVGGTDDEAKTDIRDYYWYAVGDNAGTLLPQGVYYVPPTESISGHSVITPIDGPTEVEIDPDVRLGGQKFGSGKQKWFVYIFDSNGQTYMSKATFMVAEGTFTGTDVIFDKKTPIAGFAITRNGSILFTRDNDAVDAANNQ